MTDESKDLLDSIRNSQLLRVLLIGLLVLLLQIPVLMIRGVIAERESTRFEAREEITRSWGGEQSIVGPRLVVPYLKTWQEVVDGRSLQRSSIRYASFLPEMLQIEGTLVSEIRYRGIFEVPVYRTNLELRGSFAAPDFAVWEVDPEDILWERSRVLLEISDARSIQSHTSLRIGDSTLEFLPGASESDTARPGIHAQVGPLAKDGLHDFVMPLSLNGSLGIFFVPFGRQTNIRLSAGWPDPSFQGAWLPAERTVNQHGFSAEWRIPFLGRSYAQSWDSTQDLKAAIEASRFGVRLLSPVDEYRMAERSAKYAALFLLLTFGSLWLFEVLVKVRIHSLQYLLVGAAMCLFYLLELSLSEHIGFLFAYLLAAVSVLALVFGYCAAVLGGLLRAGTITGILGALYVYLYILLMNQDYALVTGAIGLLVVLAAVMYLTRKVDWYSIRS